MASATLGSFQLFLLKGLLLGGQVRATGAGNNLEAPIEVYQQCLQLVVNVPVARKFCLARSVARW